MDFKNAKWEYEVLLQRFELVCSIFFCLLLQN
jgi:hypothetical protein